MNIITINWNILDDALKEKYENKVNQEDGLFKFVEFNINNLDWIENKDIKTNSYKIFQEEFNELQLSINVFENFLMQIDLSYENNGVMDFPIDMPREYFRFPALNNPKDIFSQKEFHIDEKNKIENILNKAQQKMNIRNDENIVKEYYAKLEFISLFSQFEAFLENIYYENQKKKKPQINNETLEKTAGMLIKQNSTDKYIDKIIQEINPEIKKLLIGIKKDIFDFFYLAYLVRNIHTHKLGKISKYFFKLGMEKNIIKEEVIKNEKGDIIERYFYVDCLLDEKRIAIDKYFSLKEITALFRSYISEVAYILDKSL